MERFRKERKSLKKKSWLAVMDFFKSCFKLNHFNLNINEKLSTHPIFLIEKYFRKNEFNICTGNVGLKINILRF